MKAVPGNLADHAAAEEEMFLAAALFGLAGTPTGVAVLLKHPEAVQGKPTRPVDATKIRYKKSQCDLSP